MSLVYCEVCKKNFMKKDYFKHKDKLNDDNLNIYFSQDITNIIHSYKYQLEIYDKYNKFIKFLDFYDTIKHFENTLVNYNCYKTDHYINDIIYIMKSHYSKNNFIYVIRHMINGKKLNKLKLNRKIYKLNIEYNNYTKKFRIKYL